MSDETHTAGHTAETAHTVRYERSIDVDSESTHARVVQLVGADRRVLELGPATGHMSRVLRDRGCAIVGIELDPEMASEASLFCERVIVGDLDELDLGAELGDDRFDVIVAADVLEHLKDPASALQRLRGFLSPGGFFVISLPNIAHGSVRLALLEGRFPYQNIGLLDETHLRFFTRDSIAALLDGAELGIATMFRQRLEITASEVPFDRDRVPAEVMRALEADPEAATYQFVIKAIPMSVDGLREVQRRLRELADENARLREAERDARRLFGGRESELRAQLIEVHDQLLRRDEEVIALSEQISELGPREQVGQLTARVDTLSGELSQALGLAEARQQEATRLRVRLDRILASPPIRVYDKVRALPGIKRLVAHRTTGYEQAVRSAIGGSDRTDD